MFEVEKYVQNWRDIKEPEAKPLWVSVYDKMIVHTHGLIATAIIEERRPYEDIKIKNYRKKIFEPITQNVILRAIDSIQRVYSKATVTIKTGDITKTYTAEPNFKGSDLHNYINRSVTKRMIEDPNGLLVWWVKGDGITQANKRVEPEPILLLSKNIVDMNEDILIFLSNEKSIVKVPNNKGGFTDKKIGDVYYVITKDAYWKRIQVGKQSDKKFDFVPYYTHDLGEIPAIILKGYETSHTNQKTNEDICYYMSFFAGFVAYGNEALRQFTDYQGVHTVSAHPIREMEEIPCVHEGCKNGKIYAVKDVSGRQERVPENCPSCKGRGMMVPDSPYGVLFRPKQKVGAFADTDNKGEKTPLLRYITPPVEILDFSNKSWQEMVEKAEKALNLLFIDEAQSGKAKEIDREQLIATLDAIGRNIYGNIYMNSLRYISQLLGDTKPSSINLPASFRNKTEAELLAEQTELKKNGAPDVIVIEATREYMRKKFSDNPIMLKLVDVLALYDPYFIYTVSEKTELYAANALSDEAYVKSINAPRALYAVALQTIAKSDLGAWESMSYDEIAKQADEFIAKNVPKPKPIVTPAGVPAA